MPLENRGQLSGVWGRSDVIEDRAISTSERLAERERVAKDERFLEMLLARLPFR
jgi:hypothetical protein